MPIPATFRRVPTLGAQKIHPCIVHELVGRLERRHVGPHHRVHAVHLRLRALIDREHHLIHVLLVRVLLLLLLLLVLLLLLLLVLLLLLLMLLLHLAAAAVVVMAAVVARMSRHVVAVGRCTAHGGHRGVRTGRCLGKRRRHVVQVSPAQLGNDAVAPLSAGVEGREAGDDLQGHADLLAPVGGLVGQGQIAETYTGYQGCLEDKVSAVCGQLGFCLCWVRDMILTRHTMLPSGPVRS